MFLNNGYPSSFFDKILASFQSSNKFSQNISFENSFCIPYLGKESHHFANRLSALIKNKYNLKISPIYKTFKVVNYFQLKSKTPVALCSNVVYKFSCSCDTNKTYIGMSSRHLITRVREHLNFKSLQDSAVKDHILSCEKCSNNRSDENNFVIIRKCKSEFCSKKHKIYCEKKMKTKNGLYVYIKSSFRISRMKFFWSLFSFRNKFVKQFAISKDRFFKLRHENFLGEKSHLCKFQTLELS